MIEGQEAIRLLEDVGARLFVGVPDSLMKGFCNALTDHEGRSRHVVAANEGGAVATAVGHYLATGRPGVVYMQNSGLGNAVNPLVSLASNRVYGVPMLLIIGWRGEPGTKDEPQHQHQGAITREQLELLEIPTTILGPEDDGDVLADAFSRADSTRTPVAALVRSGTFPASTDRGRSEGFTRVEAISTVLDALPPNTAYVATTGYTGRELALLRDRRGEARSSDLLMVGSMGHAVAIALGIALEASERPVCCLDGDGAAAMHLGTLAAVGAEQPRNLVHLILNNGVHESVGGQPSALRHADFPALALSLGYSGAGIASSPEQLATQLSDLRRRPGPWLIEARIGLGTVDGLPRPSEFRQRLDDMRNWLDG